MRSTPGRGSTFTLYLPQTYVAPAGAGVPTTEAMHMASPTALQLATTSLADRPIEQVEDDRNMLETDDPILLIVEDDPYYARILRDLARNKGFKTLVAHKGSDALTLAREFHPTAVSLDVYLPDMLGWTVLNHLKQDPATRHVPVQMLTMDEDRHHGLSRGAFSFVSKPTTAEQLEAALLKIQEFSGPRRKRLLVVEDNPMEQMSIQELLGFNDIDLSVASTGAEALAAVADQQFDCMVLDLRLPDMTGFDVLEQLRDTPALMICR